MHARENARSSEYASGRRVGPDESLVRAREGPRRKEPPVKERRERVLPEVVVNVKVEEEAGPLGRLVRASVEREREKSRTRLVPRDGSWLLVADARRPCVALFVRSRRRREAGIGVEESGFSRL